MPTVRIFDHREKYKIITNGDKISDEELRIFKKRLREYEEEKRGMKNELAFFRVLKTISEGKQIDPNNKIEIKNQQLLEGAGYIKDGKLTGKGKDLLKKLEA